MIRTNLKAKRKWSNIVESTVHYTRSRSSVRAPTTKTTTMRIYTGARGLLRTCNLIINTSWFAVLRVIRVGFIIILCLYSVCVCAHIVRDEIDER